MLETFNTLTCSRRGFRKPAYFGNIYLEVLVDGEVIVTKDLSFSPLVLAPAEEKGALYFLPISGVLL